MQIAPERYVNTARASCGMVMCALAAMACSTPTEPQKELVPGYIAGFEQNDPLFTVDNVGTSLTVTVVSFGNTCRSMGELRVDVSRDARRVSVAPFDWSVNGSTCEDVLQRFQHSTVIDLEVGGSWQVVIQGQDIRDEAVQVARQIDVRS